MMGLKWAQFLVFLLLWLTPCECPALPTPGSALEDRWREASERLASQWHNPNDVLTVLLIIGGDIVQKALAQLSGNNFVPVAFSFGWVSYSINALLVIHGDGTLMPSTMYPSILINARSGYGRLNYSWILNRLLRGVESELEPLDAALCVSVFQCRPHDGKMLADWLWWSGVVTIGLQHGIAVIPFIVNGDWSIFLVTGTGTLLALMGGSLRQWRKEKWGSHFDNKGTTYCLTRGNGFQHVVVIQNEQQGCLNLESLALPQRNASSRSCKAMVTVLAVLWIGFLINVCGLRQNTWYLLSVGFVGMVQNISVAAIPRQPSSMGLQLTLIARIKKQKVMSVLMETEDRFPSVGAALLRTFFPGELRDHEHTYWSRIANETPEKTTVRGTAPSVSPLDSRTDSLAELTKVPLRDTLLQPSNSLSLTRGRPQNVTPRPRHSSV